MEGSTNQATNPQNADPTPERSTVDPGMVYDYDSMASILQSAQRKKNATIALLSVMFIGAIAVIAVLVTQEDIQQHTQVREATTHERTVVHDIRTSMDINVSPCDDFYRYACGGWLDANTIPSDESSWERSFSEIHHQAQQQLKVLLSRPDAGIAKVFYDSCMDKLEANQRGLDIPLLQSLFKLADEIPVNNVTAVLNTTANLMRQGIGTLLSAGVEVDVRDATHYMFTLGQGGLGLPDRSYYLEKSFQETQEKYRTHIAEMLVLTGVPVAEAASLAADVFEFEKQLAQASLSREELRDPEKLYNKMSLEKLDALVLSLPATTTSTTVTATTTTPLPTTAVAGQGEVMKAETQQLVEDGEDVVEEANDHDDGEAKLDGGAVQKPDSEKQVQPHGMSLKPLGSQPVVEPKVTESLQAEGDGVASHLVGKVEDLDGKPEEGLVKAGDAVKADDVKPTDGEVKPDEVELKADDAEAKVDDDAKVSDGDVKPDEDAKPTEGEVKPSEQAAPVETQNDQQSTPKVAMAAAAMQTGKNPHDKANAAMIPEGAPEMDENEQEAKAEETTTATASPSPSTEPSPVAEVPPTWLTFVQQVVSPEQKIDKSFEVNVEVVQFLRALTDAVQSAEVKTIHAYYRFHILHAFASVLASDVYDKHFEFYGKFLNGQESQQERWKRCVSLTDGSLPDAVSQAYVDAHFDDSTKSAAKDIIVTIEDAFEDRLDNLTWMDTESRSATRDKLKKLTNLVGFPDDWISYDDLGISSGELFENVQRTRAFSVTREINKIGKSVDKKEWDMSAPTVNAYYDPSKNIMVFPAGILQLPFFGSSLPAALNFGGIGAVMGHELTHAFDDEGRKYDGDGNLRQWMTNQSVAQFEKNADCVKTQFDRFTVPNNPSMNVSGELTLGENIADLGGLTSAYYAFQAYKRSRSGDTRKDTSFSNVLALDEDQLFFVAYAQNWCGKATAESSRLRGKTDPHSPVEYRVRGPLSNFDRFAQAFNCSADSTYVRKSPCLVW